VIARTIRYHKTKSGRDARKKDADWQRTSVPHKIFARGILLAAVRAGYVKRGPCVDCGDLKTDGHHHDYMKPFDVIWLCRKHHMETHRRIRLEELNKKVARNRGA
jgi:hypothetical protein